MRDALPTATTADVDRGYAGWLTVGCLTSMAVLVRFGVDGLPAAVAAPGLALIAAVDQVTHRVPNRLLAITGLGFGVAAALSTAAGGGGFASGLAVGGAWLAVLVAVHVLDPGLGFGDVKLGGLLGLVLGWAAHAAGLDIPAAAGVSALAFLSACAATLAISRRHERRTPVAFAPGLVAATLVAVVVLVVAAPT